MDKNKENNTDKMRNVFQGCTTKLQISNYFSLYGKGSTTNLVQFAVHLLSEV